MNLTISSLAEEYINEVLQIETSVHSHPWTRGMFAQEIGYELSTFLVFFDATHIVGYGGFWDMAGHGHISNIAVSPEKQRQGIGRFILEELLQQMLSQKIEEATLEVRESNQPARGLYETLGFTNMGSRKNYYPDGETAVIYTKKL